MCTVRGRRRGRRRGAIGATVAGALLVVLSPAAVLAEEGLDQTAVTTYTVDLPSGLVRARVELTIENVKPDSENYFYYWDLAGIAAPSDATNVVAIDGDGDTLPVEVIPQGEEFASYANIVVSLDGNLNYGERETLTITYDLPGSAPRSDAAGRINQAYAGFIAVANGDPGQSSVQVVAPLDNDLWDEFVADGTIDPVRNTYGDQGVLTWNDIADPFTFFAYITAFDGEALTTTVVPAGREEIVIRGWPDDPEWQAYMSEQIPLSLTGLEKAIGVPFDESLDLEVRQSAAPSFEGYGGWFDSQTGVIEVVEDIDPVLATHELAHAWFAGDFASERWISEGFAETYANIVVAATGGTPAPATTPSLSFALNSWTSGTTDEEVEADGYATSAYLVGALYDEIGEERMRDVLRVMLDRESVYGDGVHTTLPSWEQFLDALEEVGGSTQAVSLFEQHVLTRTQAEQLVARAAARDAYDVLARRGDGWAVPDAVAQAMHSWRFDRAEQLMTAASTVLDARDELDIVVDGSGIAPPALAEAYTAARDDEALADIEEELARFRKASETLLAERADLDERVADIGMSSPDLAADFAAVRTAEDLGVLTEQVIEINADVSGLIDAHEDLDALFAEGGLTMPDLTEDFAATGVDDIDTLSDRLLALHDAGERVITARDDLDATLRDTGLALPDLTADYAASTTVDGLDALAERLSALRVAGESVLDTRAALARPLTPDQQLGLMGVDLAAALDDAAAALEAEDLDTVTATLDAIETQLDGAAELGAQRRIAFTQTVPRDTGPAITGGVIGAAVVLLGLAAWRVTRRRRRSEPSR